MKTRVFAVLFVSALLLMFCACGSGGSSTSTPTANSATTPTSNPNPTPSPNQFGTLSQISEKTTCEAMNPDDCSGGYGFLIDQTGRFTAGPSLAGMVLQGTITADELNTLSVDANAYLASVIQLAPCSAVPSVPGVADLITLLTSTGAKITVLDVGALSGGTCAIADDTKASALELYLQQLRGKYYPVPFPSQ
jgi:hypothetical protein